MADSEVDTSRTVVRTYVPAYQREAWDDHAEELDMSRSEFVRAMVQAGRRGFEATATPPDTGGDAGTDTDADAGPDDGGGTSTASTALESTVVDVLSADEYLSWEELLAAVTDDVEARLEETLQELQAEDVVRYSGRNGGYALER